MSSRTESVRTEVAGWLEDAWDPALSLREWRNRLVDSGWGRPSWPREWYGRGMAPEFDSVVRAEFRRVGAVGVAPGHGTELVAPALLRHGSNELKLRFLRPMLTGEHIWCQLFSEPGAGSDLAGLTTRAERGHDGWIINGQKTWSSGAHHAARGMLLARTNWDAPKHQGISCFTLDMTQPGIEVRPIRQMNGYSSFNDVFFTDVRVGIDDLLGDVDEGWSVALTTLAHERRLSAELSSRPHREGQGRVNQEAQMEQNDSLSPYRWYRQRGGRPDLVVEVARQMARNKDPLIRQALARLHSVGRTADWTAKRAQAARSVGRSFGPEGSLGKLHSSQIARCGADVHALIAGPWAAITGPDAMFDGVIADILMSVPAASIAGGTDEIQRNIVSERVLRLPKEPQYDDVPFRDIARNNAPW